MKYVAIFHANLNYAFLEEKKYEQVIRASYETIFDVFAKKFPHQKFIFETSGYTIEHMALKTPDVLKKLIQACERGQCEFMGAPYAHPVLANVTAEEGLWSLRFSMETFRKRLGFLPESGWNPECTWKQYVPQVFRDAGFKYLTLDFEAYMASTHKEYSWIERNRTHDMYWGGNLPEYDLDPNCPGLHRPFRDIVPGLHGFCRSDRLVGGYLSYFMGKMSIEAYLDRIRKWTGTDKKGATVIIADDAEYTGTTGYYYVKYYDDYSRSFEVDPGAADKLTRLLEGLDKMGGELITFKQACQLPPVDEPYFCEDGLAWHRTWSECWGSTPEAQRWDPQIAVLRHEYKDECQAFLEGPKASKADRELAKRFWFHLTNSSNSDGRWPPPPRKTCEFNRNWVLAEMRATKMVLAECKKAVKGRAPLPAPKPVDEPDWEYGLRYTGKNARDLAKLNFYELSHHLYASYKLWDHGTGKVKERGRRQINAIYDEFERRGFKQYVNRRLPAPSK